MGRPKGHGIFGPYKHGTKYRLLIRRQGGGQDLEVYDDEATAQAVADALRRRFGTAAELDGRTVRQAHAAYQDEHQRPKGNKEGTLTVSRIRLETFFGKRFDSPLQAITERAAVDLYEGFTKAVSTRTRRVYSVDTCWGSLAEARALFGWCVEQQWIAANPFAAIKPTGKRKHGKEQLRIDEARKWMTHAVQLAEGGEAGAVAALMALVLGMRASEIVSRVARDLDDDGRLLWIPDSKTPAGRRTLEVPDATVYKDEDGQPVREGVPLRALLLELVKGKAPQARIFEGHWRDWPRKWVQRICEEVGVPLVTAHGMRGLNSTLAVQAGMAGHLVARQLGHTSFQRTTARSYVAPGTVEQVERHRGLQVITGGRR